MYEKSQNKNQDYNLSDKDRIDLNKKVINNLSNINRKYRRNYKSVVITKLFLFSICILGFYYWDIFNILNIYLDTLNKHSTWYYVCISFIWLIVVLFLIFIIQRYFKIRQNFKEYNPKEFTIFNEKTYANLNKYNQLNVLISDELQKYTQHLKIHKKVIYLKNKELTKVDLIREAISFLNPRVIANNSKPYDKTDLSDYIIVDLESSFKMFNNSNELATKNCRIVYDKNAKYPYITYKISDRFYLPSIQKGTRFDYTLHINPDFFVFEDVTE